MHFSNYKLHFFIATFLLALCVVFQMIGLPENIDLFFALNIWGRQINEAVWSFLTLLGDTGILWPMLLIFSINSINSVYAVLAAVPLGGFLSVALKSLFDSSRPAGVLQIEDFHVIGPVLKTHSFPSGHTITIFAAMSALIYTCAFKNKTFNLFARFAFMCLACLVALSRVMVGAHWPIDCLAGACVGWISGLSGQYLVERFKQNLLGIRLEITMVCLLWILSVSNFFRTFADPMGYLAVQTSFLIATLMFIAYLYKNKRSIAGFFS